MKRSVVAVIASLVGFSYSLHAHRIQSPCRNRLEMPAQEVSNIRDFFSEYDLHYNEGSGRRPGEPTEVFSTTVTDRGHEVAESTYIYTHDSRDLNSYYIFIEQDPRFVKQGFSTKFLERALQKFPDTESLSASFIYDNELIFKMYRAEGFSVEESFKQTPFYKAASKLGFGIIDLKNSTEKPPKIRLVKSAQN